MHPSLTGGQLRALQLLARRLQREEPGWINLADALVLESVGLAKHEGRGWVISPAGEQALRSAPPRTPRHPRPYRLRRRRTVTFCRRSFRTPPVCGRARLAALGGPSIGRARASGCEPSATFGDRSNR